MPVTDRLLTKLQETLGEGPTRDLVTWVDEAGAVNRAEVREVADLYLSRFDERLEWRLAEWDAKLQRRLAELEGRIDNKMSAGFAAVRVEMQTGYRRSIVTSCGGSSSSGPGHSSRWPAS